jgi:acrylyl-CoA reductase (NADPH)
VSLPTPSDYRAIVVDRPIPDARPEAVLRHVAGSDLAPADPVEVDVLFSSVNFKDALALTGGPGILAQLPMVPGIDVVGRVRRAAHGWSEGDVVVVNGAGLGERTDGGLAERASVPATSAIALPDGMSARTAAAIGTAGFTAALAVEAIAAAVDPDAGEILVTGARGGVGSFSLSLLAARGYRAVAVSGRPEQTDQLIALGAARVIGRDEIGTETGKALQPGRWAGAIDSVGGPMLVNVLAQTSYGGIVAACGMAQSIQLPGTVMPFILRAVTLAGINSVDAPLARRQAAWDLLASVPEDVIEAIAPRTEPLDRSAQVAREVLAGRVSGRVVIDTRS